MLFWNKLGCTARFRRSLWRGSLKEQLGLQQAESCIDFPGTFLASPASHRLALLFQPLAQSRQQAGCFSWRRPPLQLFRSKRCCPLSKPWLVAGVLCKGMQRGLETDRSGWTLSHSTEVLSFCLPQAPQMPWSSGGSSKTTARSATSTKHFSLCVGAICWHRSALPQSGSHNFEFPL